MNCVIPGLNLKVFAKALHALAKIGDDLYIEATEEKLTLVALNLRKTVCVRYYFLENFFSSYEVHTNKKDKELLTCKIHMKTLLPLFKGTHLEKKLEFVKLEYEENSDLIIFKLKYKCDDILMVHKLRLMDAETLTIEISPESGSNSMVTTSSFYNQLLNMFSNLDDEITLEISKQKVVARNYFIGAPLKPKSVRSQVNLNSSEFNVFQIGSETTVNFSLKPFRTAIQFADGFNLNIGLNFEKGGRPLAIVMKNPSFEVNFIVATLNPYSDVQSSMTTSSIPAKITQHHTENIITAEDRQALLDENWEDFNLETNKKQTESNKSNNNRKSFQLIVENTVQKPNNNNIKEKQYTRCSSENSVDAPKRNKIFVLPAESPLQEKNDVIARSPESPRTKKAKLVFGRCFESTFSSQSLGEVLAPNSDSE